ncbi:MAG: glycosyltransferase [Victivallales bacterium]|nr:glycosyltransferase [Victivallales bacterium]
MKILVFLEEAKVRGGIEIFAERHIAELKSEGHEVICLNKLENVDFQVFDQIIVHKCGDVKTLATFPPDKTTYYIHDHEPICPRGYAYTPLKNNCTRPGGFWPCILCAPLCKDWKKGLSRTLSQNRRKSIISQFKEIVVISDFMKSRLVANGIEAERIQVRPPQIKLKASSLPCPEENMDLLFVGQLIRGKGVNLLIEAMSRMKRKRTLDIVGTGNMEGELKELAASLGLAERVRFHGFQANPQDWMAAAQCVVVPSFWQEPYGLVAAEAVALGKKVVAFAIGGLPEACQGKATMVPPGDVNALAQALDADQEPHKPVKVFVFVDALGWKQTSQYGFLDDLLPYRRKIEMQFGYSCTAIPTILTGVRPSEHGHLAFYDWAPEHSPFSAMRYISRLFWPRSFWRRGRVRNILSRLIKKLYGFTGYFQLYGIPMERLPKLDYCEKKDLFIKGGLAPVKNLADTWAEQGLQFHISDWRRPEAENFSIATDLLAQGKLDRAFVYSAEFDALQHDNVGKDEALIPKVKQYEQRIRKLHEALVKAGRPFELTVFSDHGMTPLRGTIDAPSALAATGLVWGKDYASAIDSTMARFWWLNDKAKDIVTAAFKDFPGHWLTEDEMKYHGIWREDAKFGNAIFLAMPGIQFCPSDMGVKPLNGMHGFDPSDVDSQACWLSTAPVPDNVSRVCDYFRVMTAP